MRNVPASSQDASLRPDQRLAKQRREAAERQALIDSRKRLPFKPIVLLCDKKKRKKAQKPKGKRFCYCYLFRSVDDEFG